MHVPSLPAAEAAELVEQLAQALEELVDQSCEEMGPLWLAASRSARSMLGEHALPDMGFEPSEAFLRLSKGAHSRYRSLAAWRHAVLWRGTLCHVEDED